ncbi:ABC transporter ATP-binding protein [Rhodocaloribacter sp.]
MAEPAVSVQKVTHRYGDHVALREVSFDVEAGMFFGLLGPNGGGKTTLFRILSTLLRPTEGAAAVFGADTARAPHDVRRNLGVIFQQPALDDELTVLENLRIHGALYGLGKRDLSRRIAALLERFGLEKRARDRVKALSGGLQRRVDLARGLLHNPRLLLLDEPTTGLDPAARRAFWDALEPLRRDEGATIIVATHLLNEADACDRIGILDRGRLVALGSPEALKTELGDATLWLSADDPRALAESIRTRLGFEARVIGAQVQVLHPDPPAILPALYETFGDLLKSATVRTPTLEDVFMVHAGHALDEAAHGETLPA